MSNFFHEASNLPARSPVDDALDRLENYIQGGDGTAPEMLNTVATVRDELQRLREERDALHETSANQAGENRAAEAENQRLRTALADAEFMRDGYFAAVQRLTEGLRVALTMIERASFDAHDREWAREQTTNLRALLVASPPDGGGA